MTYLSPKAATAKSVIQAFELQASAKTTQKKFAQPGQAFIIVVDGQVYTGQKKINHRGLRLERKGDALLLVAEDQAEPLLEVSGFYAPADAASA